MHVNTNECDIYTEVYGPEATPTPQILDTCNISQEGAISIAVRPTNPQRSIKPPFQDLDLYWRSPESGDLWYTPRQLKKTICAGWWHLGTGGRD